MHSWLARGLAAMMVSCVGLHASAQGVAHETFDKTLRANVRDGQVNYPGIQADAAFKTYVEQLAASAAAPSTKADKLAYYMNAYNALAIQGIIDGYSPSSFFGRQRFFKQKEWKLAGKSITLDNLEHKILRPLGDARIHFGIVCASQSCPKIRKDAFTAAQVDAQLDENARAFINDPARNRFDKEKKRAELSMIFKWFAEDFVAAAGSVQKYLARYVNDPEVAKALAAEQYSLSYLDYLWTLNGTPPKK